MENIIVLNANSVVMKTLEKLFPKILVVIFRNVASTTPTELFGVVAAATASNLSILTVNQSILMSVNKLSYNQIFITDKLISVLCCKSAFNCFY